MAEPWKSWLKIWCCDVNAAVVLILKNEKEARINQKIFFKVEISGKKDPKVAKIIILEPSYILYFRG